MSDTPKLVELNNVRVLDTWMEKCKASAVETLEEILAMAQAGQIKQVAIIFTMPNGKSGDSMSMMDDRISLFGALSLARDAMSERIRSDDKPVEDLLDPEDDPA